MAHIPMLLPSRDKTLDAPSDERMALSEVVSALSFALDLTEDAVPGHAVRSCLLGMRIGNKLGLGETELHDLYYALLLKDVGCSSNAGRMCQILGSDDRKAKREVKTLDWTRASAASLKYAWSNTLPGANLPRKLWHLAQLGLHQDHNNAEMIGLRCERGANIVRKIGFSQQCADAIYSLDEHWDGSGYPERLKRTNASILSRILGVAQHLDVFASEQGRDQALKTLAGRGGAWFDPELVSIALSLRSEGSLWSGIGTPDERAIVLDLEPGTIRTIGPEEVDRVCEGFADVVDAKSSFTYHHSIGVMQAAVGISRQLGLAPAQEQLIYRAALLHDLGKLRVPNTILDKPSSLTPEEWLIVREHPLLSQQILERIPSFASIARIAGRHHEKLDGTGYPYGLQGDALSLEDRIVAMADLYAALSEDRPYRKGMPIEQTISILRKTVPLKLDSSCFEALLAFIGHQEISSDAAASQALREL